MLSDPYCCEQLTLNLWVVWNDLLFCLSSIPAAKYREEKRFYKHTCGDNISTGPFPPGSVQRWVMGCCLQKWPQSVFLTLMSINSNESLDLDPCSRVRRASARVEHCVVFAGAWQNIAASPAHRFPWLRVTDVSCSRNRGLEEREMEEVEMGEITFAGNDYYFFFFLNLRRLCTWNCKRDSCALLKALLRAN